ncbi:hypothetical protein WR25_25643 [Diploscapter pachys]|uniref:Uncharacterized protein n=1 Tax=Diploscapter pachys TaxID=2018661 RepID=A0A2A2KLA4_9BILA|nr:hypothetical protein WR25_25643 [Diploscapter pachys]
MSFIREKRSSFRTLLRQKRMSPGVSRLYELQPDPYDDAQRRCMRVCLFTNVQNAKELREMVRDGKIDASLIRAELVYEPFVLLAAANRAVHQAAHNRMSCRSMHAELIYSLSPSRNVIKKIYQVGDMEKDEDLSDHLISRLITKDFMS